MVSVQFDIDSAGYIDGWTDAEFADQTKLTDVDQSELDTCVLGATKLVDGHLVLDEAKQAEIDTPVPDAQDLINAQMMKTTAQLTLTNAALMKQVATLEAKTNG